MKRVVAVLTMLVVQTGCVVVVDTDEPSRHPLLTIDRDQAVPGAREVVFKAHGRVIVKQGAEDRVTINASRSVYDAVKVRQVGPVLTISGPPVEDAARADERANEMEVTITLRRPERITLRGRGVVQLAPVEVRSLELVLDGQGRIDAAGVNADALTLTMRGHGDLHVADATVDRLSVALSGHGNILLDAVDATRVDAGIRGHGRVRLAGKADQQRLRLAGHGDWEAADLETRAASLAIDGHGTADVWVVDHLTVDVARHGLVNYRGSPVLDVRGYSPVHQVRTSAVASHVTAIASAR